MSTHEELHERWSREEDYREAYERLEPEFEVARRHQVGHPEQHGPSIDQGGRMR